jgi:hypothetical protein
MHLWMRIVARSVRRVTAGIGAGAAPPPQGAPKENDSSWETAPATRRSGFTAGLLAGMSFGTVAGFPNEFSKIDVESFRSATSGVGPSGMLYLGGALTDWFTFGFGLARSSYGSDRLVTESSAYLFHIEAFPLFARGGMWRDIALFADFGTGSATIKRRDDGVQHAASGALSIASVALGGVAPAGHAFSTVRGLALRQQSMARTFGEIGFRGVFYGGP